MKLHRYWFEFEDTSDFNLPKVFLLGCGVTAYDLDDALRLLQGRILQGNKTSYVRVVENIDVSTLDPKHVLPNIGLVNSRGIWFPQGY
jgi:hypothetical protein